MRIVGEGSGERFGEIVANVGDMDGDGLDDVVTCGPSGIEWIRWTTGLYLALHAKGGVQGRVAFLVLAALWLATTTHGVRLIVLSGSADGRVTPRGVSVLERAIDRTEDPVVIVVAP